jgi:thiosulfate/3-mercaptopyruvate sulfurtransferase
LKIVLVGILIAVEVFRASLTNVIWMKGAFGITNDTHVVIYDAVQGIGSAARVLWTFRVFGHIGGVSVLDGGLQRWKAEGRPVETSPTATNAVAEPVKYTAKFNPALVKTFEEVRENLYSQQNLVVDARPAGR